MPRLANAFLLVVLAATPAFAQATPPWSKPEGTALDRTDYDAVDAALKSCRTAQAALADGKRQDAAAALGVQTFPEESAAEWKKAIDARAEALTDLLGTLADRLDGKDKGAIADMRRVAESELLILRVQAGYERPFDSAGDTLDAFQARTAKASQDLQAAKSTLETRQERLRQLDDQEKTFPPRLAALKAQLADSELVPGDSLGAFQRETLLVRACYYRERIAFIPTARDRWKDLVVVRDLQFQAAQVRLRTAQKEEERARTDTIVQARIRQEAAAKRVAAAKAELLAAAGPLPRFRAEMQVQAAEIDMESEEDIVFGARLSPRTDEQREVNLALAESWNALKERFSADRGVSKRTPQLLLGTLKRIQQNRSTLDRRLGPELEENLGRFLKSRADVQDHLLELAPKPEEEPALYLDLIAKVEDGDGERVKAEYAAGVEVLRAALRRRDAELEKVIAALEEQGRLYDARRNLLDEMYTFIFSRIYWVRNEEPLGISSIVAIRDEVEHIVRNYTGSTVRNGVVSAYRQGSWRFAVLFVAFVLLLVLGWLIVRWLRRYQKRWDYKGGPLLVAVQRIGVTVLFAALAPGVLALAALLLGILNFPDALTIPGRLVLFGIAIASFARRFLWNFFREEGIARTEFRAPPAVAEQLYRASRWVTFGFVAFALPWWITDAAPLSPPPLTVIPRVLYTAMLAFYAFVLLSLLRRRGALMVALTGGKGIGHRLLFFIEPMLFLGFLGILAMDILGYRFGAKLLTGNVLQTFLWGLFMIGIYNLLTSVIQHAANRVRQRKRQELSAKEAYEKSIEVFEQLSRFAGVTFVVTAVVMLARFWGLAGGLESFLGSIALPKFTQVSLWDLLVALLWIGAGHFVMRHLSALYEVLIFPRLEGTDAGTRYVIVTISKYLVFLFAYSSSLLSLGFSFTSLGVVLAAVSLGIGFGLQEIVANFVSGLILFFERPVRVGDIVTVGGNVGTVERINIRATLVTNFDRQVMIIPNRRFIADEVTNWTHNDTLVRGAIEVGISYGSDVEKASRVLLEIARTHPKVKKDPEPRLLFVSFGDSSLNLRVWIFTEINDRMPTISEINGKIVTRFREENIEIPFPQRDVHVRSIQDDTLLGAIKARTEPGS